MSQMKSKRLIGCYPWSFSWVWQWCFGHVWVSIRPLCRRQRQIRNYHFLTYRICNGQLQTNADLPTKPFILNVWGSWCPTCAVEQPFLLKMQQQGVVLVGVNYKDQPADALAYLAKNGNPFVLNLQDLKGDFGIDLGVTGSPESFVIDQDQRIRMHILGEINDEVWLTQLKPCLERLTLKGAGQCV